MRETPPLAAAGFSATAPMADLRGAPPIDQVIVVAPAGFIGPLVDAAPVVVPFTMFHLSVWPPPTVAALFEAKKAATHALFVTVVIATLAVGLLLVANT